jgi:hypothetical protein
VFYCHKCQWKGNSIILAKELGVYRRLPSAEYRKLSRDRERADCAARALYELIKARRFELLDELDTLHCLESQAHEAGPDHPATWDSLALCYSRWPRVLAELAVLENAGAAELVRFVSAGPEERERAIEARVQW